jgi:phage baseplate assembly protein W
MAIIRGIKRIHPLDINTNVKIGTAFPLNTNSLFKGTDSVKEQAKSNLMNLILTRQGERLYLPDFGIGLDDLLFENNVPIDDLKERINFQINFYIPELTLLNVNVEEKKDEHLLYVQISYKHNSDDTRDSIAINFSN